MGTIHAEIKLTNMDDRALAEGGHLDGSAVRSETVTAVVDTGATSLTIPESLRARLGLKTLGRRRASLADGRTIECDQAGPVEVEWGDRSCIGSALVVPGEASVLLGVVQLEEMDLIPDPVNQRLTVNPESPDVPRWLLLGWRPDPHAPA